MSVFKDGLIINPESSQETSEYFAFLEEWVAASIATSAPVLAQMVKDGIIDENGRRISTEIPVIHAEACVEQQ
jgi:hypothetical protein